MSDLITMTCPSCGAKLRVAQDAAALLCGHCGNEYRVRHDAGSVYLAPMAQDVRQIRVGVDKTAAELAVVRLEKELIEMDKVIAAAKQGDYSHKLQPSQAVAMWGLAAVADLILLMAVSTTNQPILIAPFAIGLVVCPFGFLNAVYKHNQAAQRLRQDDIERLQAQRATKVMALEANRRIASS